VLQAIYYEWPRPDLMSSLNIIIDFQASKAAVELLIMILQASRIVVVNCTFLKGVKLKSQ